MAGGPYGALSKTGTAEAFLLGWRVLEKSVIGYKWVEEPDGQLPV